MSIARHGVQRLLSTAAILVVLVSSLGVAAPAQALSSNIVISQIYGGGGNTGAPYQSDFIELFNRGNVAVTINNWSVQYASSTGSSWTKTDIPSVTIPAGGYVLIKQATGNSCGGPCGAPLPTADFTGTISMSANAGKVALVNNTTLLSGPCPTGANIIDFVGYGPGTNCSETAPTEPNLTNTTAALRNANGCMETDHNQNDFTNGAPNPRNSSSPLNVCPADAAPIVSSTIPANGATNVALNATITINFSETVNVSGTWYGVSCLNSTPTSFSVTPASPAASFTIDPSPDFAGSDTCTVTIYAAQVTDTDLTDPPDNMAANYSFSFTTALPDTPIYTLQGAGHLSPYTGSMISTTGVVTAKVSNGFYLQDPTGDGNDNTSDAIFVYTSAAPTVNVGDFVRVTGTIAEYRPGGATTYNLTTTEITSPGRTVTVLSSGNPLPAPVIIGLGGRMPPTATIEDDSLTGNVETSNTFDPASDGIDFYESLEAMRVQVNNPRVVGPTNNYMEIFVVPDGGVWAGTFTPRGGLIYTYADGNPERVQIDDNIVSLPYVHVGDTLSTIIGVLDYQFGNYEIYPSVTPTITSGGLTREVTAPAGPNELAVAAFNVENLTVGDPQAKFDGLAALIVNNLQSPDILAISEIQDNNGTVNDGTVAADQTWNKLIAAIAAIGGPAYQYRQIDPVNNSDGGAPGGNIRVGFLFRTDRGLAFVDRPGGDAVTPNAVLTDALGPYLQYSPGRIDPLNPAFTDSRKPLVGEFTFRGRRVFVIANHWNSKGGDTPLFGYPQPPVRSSETQRMQQAAVVAGFVQQILAVDPDALIVAAGDLNDFEFSPALGVLKAAPMHDLIETLPANERYTYVYEGNSQTLDHILISDFLYAQPFSYDVVHVNAEFFDQLSDHDPEVVRLTFSELVMIATNGVGHLPAGGDGIVTPGEVLMEGPTHLLVRFTQPVQDPPGSTGADDVTNPANYSLNGMIDYVTYDAASRTATLYLNGGQPLPPGQYTLIVRGSTSIVNTSGVPLAGDGVNAGTDFVLNFSVASMAMPATGFAPGVVTPLGPQPAGLTYADLGAIWLEIPAQGVRAPIVGVPLAENGEWSVGWLYDQVGWLQGTAFPGQNGNAVLTAHVYNADGRPGPFVGLRGLSYGDQIVLHAFGQRYVYAVRTSTVVSPQDARAITRHEDRSWLTLITCQGYNADTNQYAYRRIVRAVLIEVGADR